MTDKVGRIESALLERLVKAIEPRWSECLDGEKLRKLDTEAEVGAVVRAANIAEELAEAIAAASPVEFGKESAQVFIQEELLERHIASLWPEFDIPCGKLPKDEFDRLLGKLAAELANFPRRYEVGVRLTEASPPGTLYSGSIRGDRIEQVALLGDRSIRVELMGVDWISELDEHNNIEEDYPTGLELRLKCSGYFVNSPASSLWQMLVKRVRITTGLLWALGIVRPYDWVVGGPKSEIRLFDFLTPRDDGHVSWKRFDHLAGEPIAEFGPDSVTEFIGDTSEVRKDSKHKYFAMPLDDFALLYSLEVSPSGLPDSWESLNEIIDDSTYKHVVRAADWLARGLAATEDSMKLISLATGIEVIFGAGGTRDDGIGPTIRDRCAYLLGRDNYQREQVRKRLKEAYDVRSKVLHEGAPRKGQQVEAAIETFEELLSRAIQKEVEGRARDEEASA